MSAGKLPVLATALEAWRTLFGKLEAILQLTLSFKRFAADRTLLGPRIIGGHVAELDSPTNPDLVSGGTAGMTIRHRKIARFTACVLVSMFTASCGGPWIGTEHLNDNFLDKAIFLNRGETVERKLNKELTTNYPPGSNASLLVKDLQSFGATCELRALDDTYSCKYRQYYESGMGNFFIILYFTGMLLHTYNIEFVIIVRNDLIDRVNVIVEYKMEEL